MKLPSLFWLVGACDGAVKTMARGLIAETSRTTSDVDCAGERELRRAGVEEADGVLEIDDAADRGRRAAAEVRGDGVVAVARAQRRELRRARRQVGEEGAFGAVVGEIAAAGSAAARRAAAAAGDGDEAGEGE